MDISMDWPMRSNIISGIARGILYFHMSSRQRVIHRDLKPHNILLDSEMNPKISDFGLARVFGESESISSTCVVGSCGYMSPENVLYGKVSVKSDVYSFGVIVLEIIGGMKTRQFYLECHNLGLLSYVWGLYQEEKCLELFVDAAMGSYDQSELTRAIQIGLLCVQPRPEDRPSMSMVVLMLSGDIELPQPKDPNTRFSLNANDLYVNNISEISSFTSSVLTPR